MKKENFSVPVDLKRVKITDGFWANEMELVRKEVIPYQWEALNDRIPDADKSFCMRNFKTAGELLRKAHDDKSFAAPAYSYRGFNVLPKEGEEPEEGKFYGFVFQDSDFAKWIEAVGYSLINHPDSELMKTADEAIDIVCRAQADNGYLDTYYIINGMDRVFTNLRDHHELYCFGHLLEGAISYYKATGKDKLLNAAKRYGDYVYRVFGKEEGKKKGYPGHEIAEMALAALYELTGEEKYLELAKFFIDERGKRPYYFDIEEKERAQHNNDRYDEPPKTIRYQYHQAHVPVREQTEAVGHAVRATYLYSGMADVARLTFDEELFFSCDRLFENIRKEKLYITGGIGGTHIGEAFSYGYDLPNDTAYSETCAAIGLAFFCRRMLSVKADAKYGDVMELALYNTVLSGMAMDGKSFFYVNPLSVNPKASKADERKAHVKSSRQKWFGCACCPPNIARIVSSIGAYAYTENENTLYTHLYMGGEVLYGGLKIQVETAYPSDGDVKIVVKKGSLNEEKTLAFRIPGWCENPAYSVNCKEGNVSYRTESGYLYVTAKFKEGDYVSLHFPMEIRCMRANRNVSEDIGKVAFMRGPLCYCSEEIDNGEKLWQFFVDGRKISKAFCENIVICGRSFFSIVVYGLRLINDKDEDESLYNEFSPEEYEECKMRLVPYFAWNNRGEGEMSVWLDVR